MQTRSSSFRSSNIYFLLALVLLAASAGYGLLQYRFWQAQQAAVYQNDKIADNIAEKLTSEKKAYKELSGEHAKNQTEIAKKIATILPPDENYTDLTRQLDRFFADNDEKSNPIFQSSLRFGKGEPLEDMPAVSALPVSMNIEATRDNFFKFLDFVNGAGSLENGTRLMDITSIQLNYLEGGEVLKDPKQKMNFTVEMNAYYQTPKVSRGG